jgi:hypothetical protein
MLPFQFFLFTILLRTCDPGGINYHSCGTSTTTVTVIETN